MDIYLKSSQLLESLANSVYDRDPNNPNPLFFSINEVQLVERWIIELISEVEGVKPVSVNQRAY